MERKTAGKMEGFHLLVGEMAMERELVREMGRRAIAMEMAMGLGLPVGMENKLARALGNLQ